MIVVWYSERRCQLVNATALQSPLAALIGSNNVNRLERGTTLATSHHKCDFPSF